MRTDDLPTPEVWDTSLPDWKDRIVNRRPLIPDLPLFDAVAEKALAIFKRLRLPDVIGNPTFAEAGDDWIFDFVRAVFGSYDPVRKVRMIREFLLLVPKGNAKTTYAAAIILVAAIMNERPHAELMLIAPSQKIAKRAFSQAAGMIRLDESLSAMFDPKAYSNEIVKLDEVVPSKIQIVSADPSVVTGAMATFTLIDETHEFSKMSKAADVFAEIKGSLGKRPDGFLLQITTQSKAPPTGVWKSELTIARKVRDGEMRRSMLPVLYELPPEMAKDDGWRDRRTWGMVNPNLNRSVTEDYIAGEIEKAEIDGPHQMALIASQHLNVEIGQGLNADRWAGALYWAKNAVPGLTFERMLDECDVMVAAGDVGGADDLFGFSAIGRHRKSRNWLVWCWAWCLRPVLELRKSIAPKLEELAQLGQLGITDTAAEQVEAAVEICCRIRDAGLFPKQAGIGLDPHGVAALVDALEEERFELGKHIVPVGQGYKLSGAIKGVERRLFDGRMKHGGQELMTWCVGNAKAEQRGNNVYVTKEAAGVAKIDPLIALFTGAILMDGNPEPAGNLDDFLSDPVLVAR
ncbi:terminase large subunit [Paracoccus pantotrophus]|uniref:Terminase large subunit n=2 Tax=Paracoccus TaxID=265 RepID=A0A7H9BXS8_PARPN|nr:terminase TerL endonuclease subunit [Paracoccus pantotrophus]QLH15859.1 terminase large subunit [Paracoccus pantotrophus]